MSIKDLGIQIQILYDIQLDMKIEEDGGYGSDLYGNGQGPHVQFSGIEGGTSHERSDPAGNLAGVD